MIRIRVPLIVMRLVAFMQTSSALHLSNGDDCFEMAQKLHSVEYERTSISKKVTDLQSRIASIARDESENESKLADLAAIVRGVHSDESVLLSELGSTQSYLARAEDHASSSFQIVNNTQALLTRKQRSLNEMKNKIAQEVEKADIMESEIRNLELKIQMLGNDIDASNHTAVDLHHAYMRLQNEVSNAQLRVRQLSVDRIKSRNIVNTAETAFRVTSEGARTTRQQLLIAEEGMDALSRKLDTLGNDLEHRKSLLDSDKVDIATKRHSLRALTNATFPQLQSRLATTEKRISEIRESMRVISSRVHERREIRSHHPGALNETVVKSSLESARSALRQSHKLLSAQGYKSFLSSLIETADRSGTSNRDPDDISDELPILQDSSEILSMDKELVDLNRERYSVNETLRGTSAEIRNLQAQIDGMNSVEVAHESEVSKAVQKLRQTSTEISVSRTQIEALKRRMEDQSRSLRNEGEALSIARRKLAAVEHQLADENSTLSNSLASLQELGGSFRRKMDEAVSLTRERDSAIDGEHRREIDLTSVRQCIEAERNTTQVTQAEAKSLSDQLEEKRREHTQALADVAQISRRLDGKMQRLEEVKELVNNREIHIRELQESVKYSLDERSTLTSDLGIESERLTHLESVLSDLKRQFSEMSCSA